MKISKKDNLMSDSKVIKKELPGEKMRKLKQKNKALRKFLIEETKSNKLLQAEVDQLRIEC